MNRIIVFLAFLFLIFVGQFAFARENVLEHVDDWGNPIPPNRVKHQENVLEREISSDWIKSSFPYPASYIYRMWGDGGELHAHTINKGLYFYNDSRTKLVFYGKISGDAIGYNFPYLGESNLKNFQKAVMDATSITFSSEFFEDTFWNILPEGICVLANGKTANWHFYVVPQFYEEQISPSLQMLLIISLGGNSLQIFDEISSVFLNP